MSRQPISRSSDDLHGDNEGVSSLYLAAHGSSVTEDLHNHSRVPNELDSGIRNLTTGQRKKPKTEHGGSREPSSTQISKDLSEEMLIKRRASCSAASSMSVKILPVNCAEKIIICLDVSSDMDKVIWKTKSGERFSALSVAKRAIGIFVSSKHRIDKKHEYALLILKDSAMWMYGFTKDPTHIKALLDDLTTATCESLDMTSLYNTIMEKCPPPPLSDQSQSPPYVVRAIIVYGRCQTLPDAAATKMVKYLRSSPFFFIDAVYIHDVPTPENKAEVETIYDSLCQLEHNGRSYIVSASQNPARMYQAFAQLLAHPLQRCVQGAAFYKQLLPVEG